MRKIVLLFCAVFVNSSLAAVEIQLKNRTNYSCYLCPKLQDYDLFINYQKPSGCIEVPNNTDAIITLLKRDVKTLPPGKTAINTISAELCSLQQLNFLFERRIIFKQRTFSFPIILDTYLGSCVPCLRGKQKENVRRLNGKNGFFVSRYMNCRHDTYVFEICQSESHNSVTVD